MYLPRARPKPLHDLDAVRFDEMGVAALDPSYVVAQVQPGYASSTLFFPNRPRARNVTTAMNSRYIDSSDHSEA